MNDDELKRLLDEHENQCVNWLEGNRKIKKLRHA
jgi:hypothetical protein